MNISTFTICYTLWKLCIYCQSADVQNGLSEQIGSYKDMYITVTCETKYIGLRAL